MALHRAIYAAVLLFGPRVLPGERSQWPDPTDPAAWQVLVRDWRSVFGAWDEAAVYHRPQQGRHGFALVLLRRGRAIGFVRVTPAAGRVEREFAVMSGVNAANPRTFRVARPLEVGQVDGWSWLATESIPNYPLGAVRHVGVRSRVVDEITEILDEVLTKSPGTPDHWRGSHGDLAPWNMRRQLGGTIRIIDWEDAGYAPPGVDRLYAALTGHITFGTPTPAQAEPEAIEWLTAMVRARQGPDESSGSENARLLAALQALPPG